MNKTAVSITLIIVFGSLLAYIYYINNYRYTTVSADGIAYLIDTKTGNSWMMRGARKISHDEIERAKKIEKLSDNEIAKIDGSAFLSDAGLFSTEIYNGSNYEITEIRVRLIIKESDGSESINRIYSLSPRNFTSVSKFKSAEFSASFGIALYNRKWVWEIVEVYGYESDL